MRILRAALAAGAVLAAPAGTAPPALAYEAPWCAVIPMGPGPVYMDCHYASIETCRRDIIAGNRGVCNPNPRYVAPPPTRRVKRG